MKKLTKTLLISVLTLSIPFITSCEKNNQTEPEQEEEITSDYLLNENYENLKPLSEVSLDLSKISYETEQFGIFNNVKYQQIYYDNQAYEENQGLSVLNYDTKFMFYNDEYIRFVNCPDGYVFNLKTNTTLNGDFSISHLRSKIYNEEMTLTITKETSNPYSSWSSYRDDWIIRYLANKEYLKDNDLSYTEDVIFEDDEILKDYFVSIYSIKINNAGAFRKPYYNIGIVRHESQFTGKQFYMFVMKSTTNKNKEFKEMIASFSETTSIGTAKNMIENQPLLNNPNWNDQTTNYFNTWSKQERTDWGIFTHSINDSETNSTALLARQRKFEEAMDYQFDLLPTYMHLSTNHSPSTFPLAQANILAGGNGVNGKKVMQYTYQFTSNNNNVGGSNSSDCYTPMFDIIRGKDDEFDFFDIKDKTHDTLERLANDIKKYEAPILFRLNNEMNSDWVSYCGMMTLNDPDIFQATWRYLYKLFEDNGVDNCIWIFNPNAISCPYSSWGEDLCYFPGSKYVQALGLTYYRDNNNGRVNSATFKEDYTYLYNIYKPTFINYPWIISEFGCGAGGSSSGKIYRNQASQASYVNGMFYDFNHRDENPYLQNIKGAVWFSANDHNSKGITNLYDLDIDNLPDTINEFKEGLKLNKKSQE